MIEIPLTQGKIALIDDEDYELVSRHTWYAYKGKYTFYVVTAIGGRRNPQTLLMHRLILGLDFGDKLHVDHINSNGLDNRRSNIRIATRQQNGRNQRPHGDAVSGFKGIYYHKNRRKWVAKIQVDGKQLHLGVFLDEADAAQAYDEAAIKYFGRFARLNFPTDYMCAQPGDDITRHRCNEPLAAFTGGR